MLTTPITSFRLALRHMGPLFLAPAVAAATGSAFLIPVLPAYLTQENTSLTFVSVVLAAASIGAVVGTVPASVVIRRVGEVRAAFIGLLLGAVGTASLALGGGPGLAFVACLGAGFGQSMRLLSNQSYSRKKVGAVARGRIMSLFGGGARAGVLVGPLAAGYLASWFGFGATFVVAGSVMALGALIMLSAPDGGIHRADGDVGTVDVGVNSGENRHAGAHDSSVNSGDDRRPDTTMPEAEDAETWLTVFRQHRRVIGMVGLAQMGAAAVRFGRLALIPLYGISIGLETEQLGITIAVSGAVDLVLFPIAGWLMDTFGRLFAIVPAFLLMSLGLLLLPLAESFWTLTAISAIVGFGNGIGSGTMLTISTDLAPASNPARFLAALRLLADTGRIVGTLAVGAVADRLDLTASAVLLGGVGIATAALFGLAIGETGEYEPAYSTTRP